MTTPAMTKPVEMTLADKLKARRFVITAEITPPVSCDASELLAKAMPLKGLADAVNVTDGAGAHSHLSSVTAAAILVREGIEPVLQLTCRDRNRLALQGDLMGAAASGVRNLLLLRGDDPTAGDQPETKPVFDLDTVGLMKTAALLRDKGELPSGRKVAGRAKFLLGCADTPVESAGGWAPSALRAKIAAGAEFAQTQFCMDSALLRSYVTRLSEAGIPNTFTLIVGISPLRSAKSARWMVDKLHGTTIPDFTITRLEQAGDPAAEGQRICVELIEEYAKIPGVGGVHIMAPNNESAIPAVISAARNVTLRVSA